MNEQPAHAVESEWIMDLVKLLLHAAATAILVRLSASSNRDRSRAEDNEDTVTKYN